MASQAKIDFDLKELTLEDGTKVFREVFRKANKVLAPFAFLEEKSKKREKKREIREKFRAPLPCYKIVLRKPQKEFARECLEKLFRDGFSFLSLPTGFGKTIISLFLCSFIKGRVIIFSNRCLIQKQWEETIKKYSPFSGCICSKREDLEKKPEEKFLIKNPANMKKIGEIKCILLIVDEAHSQLTKNGLNALFLVRPAMILGLSATPWRYDEFDSCFEMFFGNRANFISGENKKRLTMFSVKTDFVFPCFSRGKIDWNLVIKSMSECDKRNEFITNIISSFPKKNRWIIFTKRTNQAKILEEKLSKKNFSTSMLISNKKDFDSSADVLIGTQQKIREGFDCPNRNSIHLACDLKNYFEQYIGRATRSEETETVIVDLVDKLEKGIKSLEIHSKERNQIVEILGGKIEKIESGRNIFQKFGYLSEDGRI